LKLPVVAGIGGQVAVVFHGAQFWLFRQACASAYWSRAFAAA
jgi:hypothetical protein